MPNYPKFIFAPIVALLLFCSLALFSHAANIPEAISQWLPGTSSGNQPSKAIFSIGVTADGGKNFGTQFETWQSLDILSDIRIAPEHIGNKGSIYLVARYNNAFYMKNSRGEWLSWNLALNNLSSASENQNLEATTPIAVQKQLSNLPGNFSIWVGYKTDGEIHYNAQAFNFTVIAKDKPATACPDDCISKLLTAENSYSQIPAESQTMSSEEFIKELKEGSLILNSPKSSAEQSSVRETEYKNNLATLKSLKENPTLSSLLTMAGKTTTPFFEPITLLKNGQKVQLLSINNQVKETVFISKISENPANAFNDYQQSYPLLPDSLKNSVPNIASLQGKSVAEINTAIAALDNALASQITQLENISIASDALVPKILAGNGVDNDNDSFCKPKELFRLFNWPLKAFLTPVKDQGLRGMCWAFTTVAALESRELVQRGEPHDLSEQFLVNQVKRVWEKNDYEDGYLCTRALDDMLKHNQVLPEESFWTYNRSLNRNINAATEAAKYASSCLNYSGSCGETSHQTRTIWSNPIPGFNFAAYEDTSYRGTGVGASKPIVIWKSGDRFNHNYYRLKLTQGHTIMAAFGVREGFKKPIRGFVTDNRDVYIDGKGLEQAGSEGGHAVLIVGFINNEAIKNYQGANLYSVPENLPTSGGYYVIKNSWGCGVNGYGDGGYAYIPAEYIERYFWNLSILDMDSSRSAKWQSNNGDGKLTLFWGDQLNTDLRISKKLFDVAPPKNKLISEVNIQVSSSVASDQITQVSTFGNTATYAGYYSTIGPRTVQVIARLGNETVQQKIQVNVVNTAPTIDLSSPVAIYEEEVTKLNLAIKDINEANPSELCSRVSWQFTAPDVLYSGDNTCSATVAFGVNPNSPNRNVVVSVADSDGSRTTKTFNISVLPAANNPYPRISDAWLHEPDRLIGRDVDAVCQTGVRVPTGATIDVIKPESSYACGGSTPEPTVTRPYEASVTVDNPSNEKLTYRWEFFWVDGDIRRYLDITTQDSNSYPIPRIPLGTGRKPFACGVSVEVRGANKSYRRMQDTWLGQCIFPDLMPS